MARSACCTSSSLSLRLVWLIIEMIMGLPPFLFCLSFCVGQDNVGSLFGNHIDGADDEEAGNSREDRSVHHAQALHPMHAEVAAQHTAIFLWPDGASAGSMVPPSVVAYESAEILIRLAVFAGKGFLDNEPSLLKIRRNFSHEPDTLHNRLQILTCFIAPLVEISEIDVGRLTWVNGSQGH